MYCRVSISLKLCIVVLFAVLCVQSVHADESIESILAQHIVQSPAKLFYQETRYIELLDEPVLSSGYMYVSATHFILEQEKPYRKVMVTNHAQMWVYDSVKGTKRFRNIKRFSNKDSTIGALVLAMRTGAAKRLKDFYSITLSESEQVWTLLFVPLKDQVRKVFTSITLKGSTGQSTNIIEITYADGNRRHWKLKKLEHTEHLAEKMKTLIKEVRGR